MCWRCGGRALLLRSRSYHTIEAVPREYTGCRVAAKERKQGRIPSVVFAQTEGRNEKVSRKLLLTTDAKEVKSIFKKISPFFCSTPIDLQVRAGPGSSVVLESGTVMPIKVHRNEQTGEVLNLVMAWAEKGEAISVNVPVVFKGADVCPGLKKGGHLGKMRTSVKYLGLIEHIPQKIEVDLTKLDIGDRVFMQDIEVHPSLRLISTKNSTLPICKIYATKPVDPEQKATTPPEATQSSEATEP